MRVRYAIILDLFASDLYYIIMGSPGSGIIDVFFTCNWVIFQSFESESFNSFSLHGDKGWSCLFPSS